MNGGRERSVEELQPFRSTLSVACRSGLANRLRVLASGVALSEATGREFQMLWPNDSSTCGAGFHELFDSELPVVDLPALELETRVDAEEWWFGDAVFGDLPDFVASSERDLRCVYATWLVDPERSEQHRRILDRAHEILCELQPNEDIERLVAASTDRFIRPTVGVHIRRGDFLTARPEVVGNLDLAIEAVRSAMEAGAKTIFLATDDGAGVDLAGAKRRPSSGGDAAPVEGVRQAFRSAFGDAVIESQPRSLDRSSSIAVVDAVVDLWTLRQSDVVVGSAASSFSELAAAGRGVTCVQVGDAAPPQSRIHRTVISLGLEPLVKRIGRRVYGKDIAAAALLRRFNEPVRRLSRRAALLIHRTRKH